MPKSDLKLQSGDYAPVADRIKLFYEAFPNGRIVTDLLSYVDGRVIVKASVFRAALDVTPAATGLATERENDGEINAVACLENTETSAIGRALANLGFTASTNRPSAEEMAKVAREQARRAELTQVAAAMSVPVRLVREPLPSVYDDPVQRHANEVVEMLGLVDAAEREGLRPLRARRLRERLTAGTDAPEQLVRIRHHLREWLARQRRRRFSSPADAPTESPTVT